MSFRRLLGHVLGTRSKGVLQASKLTSNSLTFRTRVPEPLVLAVSYRIVRECPEIVRVCLCPSGVRLCRR